MWAANNKGRTISQTDMANNIMLIVWRSWQSYFKCSRNFAILKWWIANETCASYCLTRRVILCEQVIHLFVCLFVYLFATYATKQNTYYHLSLFSECFCASDGKQEQSLAINGKHWIRSLKKHWSEQMNSN